MKNVSRRRVLFLSSKICIYVFPVSTFYEITPCMYVSIGTFINILQSEDDKMSNETNKYTEHNDKNTHRKPSQQRAQQKEIKVSASRTCSKVERKLMGGSTSGLLRPPPDKVRFFFLCNFPVACIQKNNLMLTFLFRSSSFHIALILPLKNQKRLMKCCDNIHRQIHSSLYRKQMNNISCKTSSMDVVLMSLCALFECKLCRFCICVWIGWCLFTFTSIKRKRI